jgi:hypothetical protein
MKRPSTVPPSGLAAGLGPACPLPCGTARSDRRPDPSRKSTARTPVIAAKEEPS